MIARKTYVLTIVLCLVAVVFALCEYRRRFPYVPPMDKKSLPLFLGAFNVNSSPWVDDANVLISYNRKYATVWMRLTLSTSEFRVLLTIE